MPAMPAPTTMTSAARDCSGCVASAHAASRDPPTSTAATHIQSERIPHDLSLVNGPATRHDRPDLKPEA